MGETKFKVGEPVKVYSAQHKNYYVGFVKSVNENASDYKYRVCITDRASSNAYKKKFDVFCNEEDMERVK